MPFDVETHVSYTIERATGLRKANINPPRVGDRTAKGDCACDQLSSHAIMHGFTKPEARVLWNALPDGVKTAPVTADRAGVLAKVAKIAGQTVPPECEALVEGTDVETDPVLIVLSPGSPLMFGRVDSNKFISFLYLNMDRGHRIKWAKFSGEEQYEWYDAWVRADKTYERVPETVGLRGTNLTRITTAEALEASMRHSPSLMRRRPVNHTVAADEWEGTARELDFWTD